MSSSQTNPRSSKRYYRHSSLVGPVLLVGMGVLFLLNNFDLLPRNTWTILFRLWPVFFILLGIDILIGRHSLIGSFISGILLLGVVGGLIYLMTTNPAHPLFNQLTEDIGPTQINISEPLGAIDSADVTIDWNAADGSLQALEDSVDLIAGELTYYDTLDFSADIVGDHAKVRLSDENNGAVFFFDLIESAKTDAWTIGLHPNVAYDLDLDTSSGNYFLDLGALELTDLTLDASSGNIELLLPNGEYRVEIDASSGDIEISIPAALGVRITLDSSSGQLILDDAFSLVSGDIDEDSVWESDNYKEAETQINLVIDASSGNLTIEYLEK